MSDLKKADKNWICVLTDEQFTTGLTAEQRAEMKSAKAVYDDHDILKDDETYYTLYKAYKKAQKALEDYKWKVRYGTH